MATFDSVLEQKWSAEAHIVFAQMQSLFRGKTREEQAGASTYNFQVFGNDDIDYNVGRARHGTLEVTAQNISDVTATAQFYNKVFMLDQNDQNLVSFNYRDTINKKAAAAIQRAYDDVVINALLAVANSATVLPEANVADYKGMTQVAEVLNANNVPEDGRCVALTPNGFMTLIQDPLVINNFQFTNNAAATGMITGNAIVGMDIIRSTRLPTTPSASTKRCFAWQRDAVGVLLTAEPSISIAWENLHYSWSFVATMQVGAVVIDPTGVVVFDITA